MSTNRPGDQTQTAAELQLEWDADPRWEGVRPPSFCECASGA